MLILSVEISVIPIATTPDHMPNAKKTWREFHTAERKEKSNTDFSLLSHLASLGSFLASRRVASFGEGANVNLTVNECNRLLRLKHKTQKA